MLIEVIGSSGAGKTSILNKTKQNLIQSGLDVISPWEVTSSLVGLQHIKHPTAQNLITDLLGSPWILRALPKYRNLLSFAWQILWRDADNLLDKLNLYRSILRRLGSCEILRSRQIEGQIALIDEGVLQGAHPLFAHFTVPPQETNIARFVDLILLPDIVLYVKVPIEIAFERTMARPDPPVRSFTEDSLRIYFKHVFETFEYLISIPKIQERLWVVSNDSSDPEQLELIAQSLSERILSRLALNKST